MEGNESFGDSIVAAPVRSSWPYPDCKAYVTTTVLKTVCFKEELHTIEAYIITRWTIKEGL